MWKLVSNNSVKVRTDTMFETNDYSESFYVRFFRSNDGVISEHRFSIDDEIVSLSGIEEKLTDLLTAAFGYQVVVDISTSIDD